MIVKFHARGTGGGKGPTQYLLGRDGQREGATLLRGDTEQVAELIEAQAKPGDSVYYGPRTPTEGPIAVKTARLLALAYPQEFAGLTDVTLKASPAADGSLSGVSYRLDDATEQLADASRVWVVRWADYPPAAVAAENAVLEQAGLSREASWVKGATIVSLFVRH